MSLCSEKTITREILKIIRVTTVLTVNNKQVLYEINPGINEFNKIGDSEFIELRFSQMEMQQYSPELAKYLAINNLAKSVNIMHPVIQFLLKHPLEQNKWFKWAIFFIANNITNDRNFDEKSPELWDKNTIHNVRMAISHLKKVDWNEIPRDIRPPYKILYPDSGRVYEISLDYLIGKFNKTGDPLTEEKPHKIDLS